MTVAPAKPRPAAIAEPIYRAPVMPAPVDVEQLLALDPNDTLVKFPREQLIEMCERVWAL